MLLCWRTTTWGNIGWRKVYFIVVVVVVVVVVMVVVVCVVYVYLYMYMEVYMYMYMCTCMHACTCVYVYGYVYVYCVRMQPSIHRYIHVIPVFIASLQSGGYVIVATQCKHIRDSDFKV